MKDWSTVANYWENQSINNNDYPGNNLRAGSFKSLKDVDDHTSESNNNSRSNSHIILNYPREKIVKTGEKEENLKFRGKSCLTDMNRSADNVESQVNSQFNK